MNQTPEQIVGEVVEICADCESCRDFMETCLVFPELYRLRDKEQASEMPITDSDLKRLAGLCNFCALCPCFDIRAKIIQAKTKFIQRDGLDFRIRILEDLELTSRICGALPGLFNKLFKHIKTGPHAKKLAGIHPERRIPEFKKSDFLKQAKKRKFFTHTNCTRRKIALFAGCTGRFLFPEVPEAAVEIMEKLNVEVNFPDQACCGMPAMLEGDRKTALKFAGYTLDRMTEMIDKGFDIVCSCPTCGFVFKNLYPEGACFDPAYQVLVGGSETIVKIPDKNQPSGFRNVPRFMLKSDISDDGYFSDLNPVKRIRISKHTFDLGEFIVQTMQTEKRSFRFKEFNRHAVYFPPCHLREQKIGRPYQTLLKTIPGCDIAFVDGTFFCCGMAGIMGFKKDFFNASMKMGEPLMNRILEAGPEFIITDCLSCRIQFNQMTSIPVIHPVELLNDIWIDG